MKELARMSKLLVEEVDQAQTCFIEAMAEAKQGHMALAKQKVKEGSKRFLKGHRVHAGIVKRYADDPTLPLFLWITHAEDRLMNAEMFKLLAIEFISLYETLKLHQ